MKKHFLNKCSYLSLSPNFNVGCCEWWSQHDQRVATLEFDRDRKSMGVIVDSGLGKKSLLVKVLSLSSTFPTWTVCLEFRDSVFWPIHFFCNDKINIIQVGMLVV